MRKALLLATCVGLTGRAAAQAGASVSADAVVVTVGMTISTLRDLNFGTVIKGVPSTILPTAMSLLATHDSGVKSPGVVPCV